MKKANKTYESKFSKEGSPKHDIHNENLIGKQNGSLDATVKDKINNKYSGKKWFFIEHFKSISVQIDICLFF